jgi:hypothetical protein
VCTCIREKKRKREHQKAFPNDWRMRPTTTTTKAGALSFFFFYPGRYDEGKAKCRSMFGGDKQTQRK